MKKLTKIRLINWHYFANETIAVNGNTLFTGQNASGKSTILDAISFVLSAGTQNFNLAANEKGKRDLRSYVKCKLGSVNQEYLRDYDLSGHICLEFYSEKNESYFCLGCVIDVIGNVSQPKVIFYIINEEMKESFFLNEDGTIRSTSDFKKANITDLIYTTKKEIKTAYRSRLGGINEKYYTLLPKALAFKPIADVKDYIYNQMLEEKTIDVTNVKDSIRNYTELEKILKLTQDKIDSLKEIKDKYIVIKEQRDELDFYNYFSKDITRKANQTTIDSLNKKITQAESEKEAAKEAITNLSLEIEDITIEAKRIYSSLATDDTFRSEEEYESKIAKRIEDLKLAQEKSNEFVAAGEDYYCQLDIIKEYDKDIYRQLSKLTFDVKNENDYGRFVATCNSINDYIEITKNRLMNANAGNRSKLSDITFKLSDVTNKLANIDKYQLAYSKELVDFRSSLEEYLADQFHETVKVYILAEVLEVSDPSWQDTIENFLGAQRFTLIVEPYYYDACLDYYNKVKNANYYGINLLNTKKIDIFDQYDKDSLASIIETDNVDARHYINYLCGQLIMVDDVHDLDNYNQAITQSGMLYRGYTTRYLNPNIPKPFIGKQVKEIQTRKYKDLETNYRLQYSDLSTLIKNNETIISYLSNIDISAFKEGARGAKVVEVFAKEVENLKNRKAELIKGDTSALELEYNELQDKIKDLRVKKDELNYALGGFNRSIVELNEQVSNIIKANEELTKELEEIEIANPLYAKKGEELYGSGLTGESKDAFINKITELNESIKALDKTLTTAQMKYIASYNRPFEIGYDKMKQYLDEFDKLYSEDLMNYANKMREARSRAETLFKEDFLSKLRNYILEAQDEMAKINETLDSISFGKDKYQFVFPKSKEFGAIYDLIMTNIEDNASLFNPEFEKKYRQELDELFLNLSFDSDENNANFNKYTDYRTYMDYDIKIYSGNDEFYFSNISKEKSGGETQIPFYVSILASFVRIFDKAEKNGLDDSVGLILFDEVFDKMDTSRISSMMEFINKLNVQIVFACPPQKMEVMSGLCSTTVAVYRNDKETATFVVSDK